MVENGIVKLGRIGPGADMKQEFYLVVVSIEPVEKPFALNKFLNMLTLQVWLLIGVREVIDSDDKLEVFCV